MDRIKMGEFILNLRKERNLSQDDVAEITGVTFQAVSKWERGESIPDIVTLEKLSRLYNVTIDELIFGERRFNKSTSDNERNHVSSNESYQKKEDYMKPNSLKSNRIFTLIYSCIYFGFFVLAGLLPVVHFNVYGLTANANYYNIIFSNNYEIGNFILLLHFLSFVAIFVFSILIFALDVKKYVVNMILARKIILIINICLTIIFMLIFFGNLSAIYIILNCSIFHFY